MDAPPAAALDAPLAADPPPLLGAAAARAALACAGGATPVFVYCERALRAQADAALALPHAFGLRVRFAMKALPTAAVLRLLLARGLWLDAGSAPEALRALRAGAPAERVCLSSQELPPPGDAGASGGGASGGAGGGDPLAALLSRGVAVNCCSLRQVARVADALDALAARASPRASGAPDALGGSAPPPSPSPSPSPPAVASREVGLRLNPGVGSGGTAYKTNVGGPHSSFGMWHAQAGAAAALAAARGLRVVRLHTHVGSGGDPAVWRRAAALALALARRFPEVHTLNLGGGFRVARAKGERGTDLPAVGAAVRALFEAFEAEAPAPFEEGVAAGGGGGGADAAAAGGPDAANAEDGADGAGDDAADAADPSCPRAARAALAAAGAFLGGLRGGGGRRLRLEVEPGTFLVAGAGALLCAVGDVVATPAHAFVKLDCGMTELLRPSLYGAQHPVHILRDGGGGGGGGGVDGGGSGSGAGAGAGATRRFVVVGHCCESGDLVSCAPGAPEQLAERELPADVAPGDLALVGGAGAYCASMSAKNYNSFPEAAEVLVLAEGGGCRLVRRRQTLEQMTQNEECGDEAR